MKLAMSDDKDAQPRTPQKDEETPSLKVEIVPVLEVENTWKARRNLAIGIVIGYVIGFIQLIATLIVPKLVK